MNGRIRFAEFEFDGRARELRRRGIRLRLRQQPAEILAMLLEEPGEVVTRERIRERLWPDGTFVEFEHSVNSAINRLRKALGDDAARPRLVETVQRRGYRFIGSIEPVADETVSPDLVRAETAARPRRRYRWVVGLLLVAAVAGASISAWIFRSPDLSAKGRIRSIAVLPLLNLSADPEQEYFADGMTEAVTSELGRIKSLRVISRTSSMTFKGTRKSVPEIAKQLNVDALIEGSVLRDGRRVRIVAQLVTSRDAHMWTDAWERDLTDVLRLQSEVANAIARHVNAALTPRERVEITADRPPVKPEVYEAYLKGMFHLNKFNSEGLEKGVQYLHAAVAMEPSSAFAYAALALGYGMMGHDRYPDALPRAKVAAEKALEIGGDIAEAYTALAMYEMYWNWDVERAADYLRRALDLKPNLAEARRNYSWYLQLLGRQEEGLKEMQEATRLEPLVPQYPADLGWQYLDANRLGDAMTETRKALELNPDFAQALAIAGWISAENGMHTEALAFHEKAAKADAAWRWVLGRTYAVLGRKGEAMTLAAEIRRNPGPMGEWGLAVMYAAMGDNDEAFRWLEAAYRSKFSWMPWNAAFGVPDLFARLRADPRFVNLNRRVLGSRARS